MFAFCYNLYFIDGSRQFFGYRAYLLQVLINIPLDRTNLTVFQISCDETEGGGEGRRE